MANVLRSKYGLVPDLVDMKKFFHNRLNAKTSLLEVRVVMGE